MLAHLTIDEVPFLLLLVAVAFVSGGIAFMLGRRSAR
jgi:hypothetical protein